MQHLCISSIILEIISNIVLSSFRFFWLKFILVWNISASENVCENCYKFVHCCVLLSFCCLFPLLWLYISTPNLATTLQVFEFFQKIFPGAKKALTSCVWTLLIYRYTLFWSSFNGHQDDFCGYPRSISAAYNYSENHFCVPPFLLYLRSILGLYVTAYVNSNAYDRCCDKSECQHFVFLLFLFIVIFVHYLRVRYNPTPAMLR
jgi:hypothetical protein